MRFALPHQKHSLPRDTDPQNPQIASLKRACERLLGGAVTEILMPGGPQSRSWRMKLNNGKTVIVTRRSSRKLATLEERTLDALANRGANVPKVLGFNGVVMVQEDLGTLSLADAIQKMEPSHALVLLDRAIESVAGLHEAALAARLDMRMPLLGTDDKWIVGVLDQPLVISQYLKIDAPKFDQAKLFDLLICTTPSFVKWDTSTHTATVAADGKVSWFDFSTCGARNPLDDLVWLIGDESLPDLEGQEDATIDRWLPVFADDRPMPQAQDYIYSFLALHLSVRMARLLSKKGAIPWSAKRLQSVGGIGLLPLMERLCVRGERYAAKSPATEALARWFTSVRRKLPEL